MRVLVVGLGEIGSALMEIIKDVHKVTGHDIKTPTDLPDKVAVMHICFPYTEKFVEHVVAYMDKTNPDLVLIESTVLPGTTEKIHEKLLGVDICHSPVRTRKATGLTWGLYNYTKFIGPVNRQSAEKAEAYYKSLGLKTRMCKSPLETEYAKLLNLAYFGLMLGWNQEMRRLVKCFYLKFGDIIAFLEGNTVESRQRFPRPVYDGKPISGHCIIPGIQLLSEKFTSKFLEAVLDSDKRRKKELV